MSAIFISYRRNDSAAYAGRIYDSLSLRFDAAQVFMDVDDIKLGDDFVKTLEDTENKCAAIVVVIGVTWLTPRLSDPQDFVRREILSGLGGKMRVFPVLVGGATMPTEKDLPDALAPLAHLQALVIHDDSFHRDVDQLISALTTLVTSPSTASVAGAWRATVNYSWGVTQQEAFQFEIDDDELLGTASYLGTPRAIQDGEVTGNKITFSTKSLTMLGDKTYEEKHQYSAKLVDGNLKVRLQTDTGYDSRLPETFTATRTEAGRSPASESQSPEGRV